jgi:N-acetylmuramoyl-L-alanine amidase CwlA
MSVEIIDIREIRERRRLQRLRRLTRYVYAAVAVMLVVTLVLAGLKLFGKRGKEEVLPADLQAAIEQLDWVSIELLPVNEYSRPGTPVEKINAVVVHYVGNPGTTARQNRTYYERLAENHETKVSSNFLIGLEGEIIQCVPVNEVAYCSNHRNEDTISIECCHPDETGKFSEATYASLVKLTAWLLSAQGLNSGDVIRHYDVTGKECPKYFVDNEDAWDSFRAAVQQEIDALKAAEKDK